MNRYGISSVACWTLVACLVSSGPATAGDAVTDAIDAGVEYMMKQIQGKRVASKHAAGQVSLETYALLVSGVSHKDPVVRGNLEWLRDQGTAGKRHTYTLACYIFALDAAISQIEQDRMMLAPRKIRNQFRDDPRIGREYRPMLSKAVGTLASMQGKHGGWNYSNPTTRFDNSNTQFAVLGLGVGAKRNVDIDKSVWIGIVDHFVKGQQEKGPKTDRRITLMTPTDKEERDHDITLRGSSRKSGSSSRRGKKDDPKSKGRTVVKPPAPEVGLEDIEVFSRGWNYAGDWKSRKATWNMTCAGLSSLILARQNLERSLDREQAAALNKAIRDGYGWVMTHWTPTHSKYGIYSLEKAADLGEVKKFHENDWYKQVSEFLVKEQHDTGSWPGGGAHGEKDMRVATSFALLVLNRATTLLTKNPMQRIVLSGKGGADDPNDRNWVYVPKIDRTLHFPSLMRHIRMRPHVTLIAFLDDIVKSYPEEWRGELIPEMVRVRDGLKSKSALKRIDKYLEMITGSEYEDSADYSKWHRRWERVMKIGSEKRKQNVPDLLSYYKSTSKSASLKQTIMWALVQCNSRDALPLFMADLSNSDAAIRASAYSSLKAFYIDLPPPFSPKGSSSSREKQIDVIRSWCEKQEARLGG